MMNRYDKIVGFDLFYVFILLSCIVLGTISAVYLVKKFGLKRTCRGVRFIVTFHFVFKFIIFLRKRFLSAPKVAIEEVLNDIIDND